MACLNSSQFLFTKIYVKLYAFEISIHVVFSTTILKFAYRLNACFPFQCLDLNPRWSVKYNTLQYKECNLANCYFLQKGYISIIIFNKLSFITEYRYTTWTWFRSGTLKYLVNPYFTSINRNVPATQWNLHMFSEGPFCSHQSTELWFYMPDRGKKM